ncbi:response regulator transcription factor [Fodinicola feengrottensis]|uniref:response regulator transcription factor n=1 Tax=Fodinicola feengrottensis TaxID=435914 RepID=UPI0028BE8DF4|nr:response regulator [Fodinicola feengrottensis]
MGARVLVVDDDLTVRDVMERYLTHAGYRVEVRGDGEAALAAIQADPPDLVVLDLMLPGLDGLEVCRQLRAKSSIPVIMLTALGEEEDRVLGLETGADDYVTKPFSPRELVLRIGSDRIGAASHRRASRRGQGLWHGRRRRPHPRSGRPPSGPRRPRAGADDPRVRLAGLLPQTSRTGPSPT